LCSLGPALGGTPQQESLIIPWNGWLSHFSLTPCFFSLGEARPWAPLRVRLANRCPDSLPSPFHADAQGPSQMLAVPSHELRSFLRGPQCPYLTRGRIHRRRPNRIERDMPVRWCPKIRANGATYNWGPNNNHLEQNPNCQSNWPDRCSSWEFCIGRDGFCPIGQRWSVPSRWRRRLPRLTRSPR
jgi:hypothetical protein